MWNMFNWDSKLKTIYVSDKFNTDDVSDSTMFAWTTSIRWWKWTTYDPSIVNKRYARVDKLLVPWYFTNILDKEYKIDYELGWWTFTWKIETYTSRDSFILINPTKTGYVFLWWTWSNWLIPQVEVKIDTWTQWNLEFTANWKLIPVEPNKSSWWGGWGWGGWGWWTSKSDDKSEDIHGSADEKIIEVEEKGKTFIEREDNKLFAEENKNEIDYFNVLK